MKIGILGEKKSVLAFKALGVEAFGINSEKDLELAKKEINDDFAILFITEDIAFKYARQTESFYSKTLPAVLVVPGIKGSSTKGRDGLKKILERALGSEIISI